MLFVLIEQMHEVELKELYCEDNPLLEKRPVHAIQEEDILTLKVTNLPSKPFKMFLNLFLFQISKSFELKQF